MSKEEAFELAIVVASIMGLGVAIAFLYVGVRFRYLIRAAANQILAILLIAAVVVLLLLPLRLLDGSRVGAFTFTGIGLLITWYLFVNTKRLAREYARDTAAGDVPDAFSQGPD